MQPKWQTDKTGKKNSDEVAVLPKSWFWRALQGFIYFEPKLMFHKVEAQSHKGERYFGVLLPALLPAAFF